MREVFSLFDHDCDGYIDLKDLGKVLRSFGMNPTEVEIQDTITQFEDDGLYFSFAILQRKFCNLFCFP